MNQKQFIVLSYFIFIFSSISIIYGLEHFVWLALGIATIFLWLVFLFADRFEGRRLAILRVVLGYPLLLTLLVGLSYWIWQAANNRKASEAFPLPFDELHAITGKASLSYSSLTGDIYNGSSWLVRRVIFSVKVKEEKRNFTHTILLQPKQSVSFSVYTGMSDESGKPPNWNIEEAFGELIDTEPRGLNSHEQKSLTLIKDLLKMSSSERVNALIKRKDLRDQTLFEMLTSTDEVVSDEYLHLWLAGLYEDARDFNTALAYLQEVWPPKTDDGKRLGHLHAKVLRGLGRFKDSIKISKDSMGFKPENSAAMLALSLDQAVAWEHLGKPISAIKEWKKADELLRKPVRSNERQSVYGDYLFGYSDRKKVGFTGKDVTSQFIGARIDALKRNIILKVTAALAFFASIATGWLIMRRRRTTLLRK